MRKEVINSEIIRFIVNFSMDKVCDFLDSNFEHELSMKLQKCMEEIQSKNPLKKRISTWKETNSYRCLNLIDGVKSCPFVIIKEGIDYCSYLNFWNMPIPIDIIENCPKDNDFKLDSNTLCGMSRDKVCSKKCKTSDVCLENLNEIPKNNIKMSNQDFEKFVEHIFDKIRFKLLGTKQKEYNPDGKPRLEFFYEGGQDHKCSPERYCFGIQDKQLRSRKDWILSNQFERDFEEFNQTYDAFEEKIIDIIDYDILMLGLLSERYKMKVI